VDIDDLDLGMLGPANDEPPAEDGRPISDLSDDEVLARYGHLTLRAWRDLEKTLDADDYRRVKRLLWPNDRSLLEQIDSFFGPSAKFQASHAAMQKSFARLDTLAEAVGPMPPRPEIQLLRELVKAQRDQAAATDEAMAQAAKTHRVTRAGVIAAMDAALVAAVTLGAGHASRALTVALGVAGLVATFLAWLPLTSYERKIRKSVAGGG
jgi:predicted transcriptional regulator